MSKDLRPGHTKLKLNLESLMDLLRYLTIIVWPTIKKFLKTCLCFGCVFCINITTLISMLSLCFNSFYYVYYNPENFGELVNMFFHGDWNYIEDINRIIVDSLLNFG